MDEIKEIFQLIAQEHMEEAVQRGIKYFQLKFSIDSMELVVPPQSPIWKVEAADRLYFYSVAGVYYQYFGPQVYACAFFKEIWQATKDLPVKWEYYSKYLMQCHYLFISQNRYFQVHQDYNKLFKDVWQFNHDKQLHRHHSKIRIGYLSADFNRCVLADFIGVLTAYYNQEDFQVYCFANGKIDDVTEFYQSCPVEWVDITGLNAPDAARAIYSREIDILFDLAGHTRYNLPILAYKPAPVQMCGIGYFATTGLDRVDYFLTDKYLCHEYTGKYFVEKLLPMSQSHFCYWPRKEMPQEIHGAPCCVNGYITFGSFNDPIKVNSVVLQTWQRILTAVPNSRLLLKGRMFNAYQGIETMKNMLLDAGIELDRVELRGFSRDYLREYWDVDIALDTFPYPGGGTTCAALYMGVPVITLGDGSHGGDFGVSILKNIGMEACCSYSVDEYVEKAVLLASDRELLQDLHLQLRNIMEASPLMDKEGYMRDLENNYRKIWQNYLQEELDMSKSGALKISACYIVKNEAKNLAKSLKSLKTQVNEIVVVDTGSIDNTIAVARKLGAKVYSFSWQDDFSKARNFALSKAKGDWLILLDADEYFTAKTAGNIRQVIRQAHQADALLIQMVNYDVDKAEIQDYFYQLRIVRNQQGIHYEGKIHEELKLSDGKSMNFIRILPEMLQIYHTGYASSVSRQKLERNLSFLQQAVENGQSEADLARYFCDCYLGLGDMEKCTYYGWLDVKQGRRSVNFGSRCHRVLMAYYAGLVM